MRNWLPNTASAVGEKRLNDFWAIVDRSCADREAGKDSNEIFHAHVNAILGLIRPLMPDYGDRPVRGNVDIF